MLGEVEGRIRVPRGWQGDGDPELPPSLRFPFVANHRKCGCPGSRGFETREATVITELVCPGSHPHATTSLTLPVSLPRGNVGMADGSCIASPSVAITGSVPSQVWKRARPFDKLRAGSGAPTFMRFALDESQENSAGDLGHPPWDRHQVDCLLPIATGWALR